MYTTNYTILKGTASLKSAENFVAKYYANDPSVAIEAQGSGEYVRYVVVAFH